MGRAQLFILNGSPDGRGPRDRSTAARRSPKARPVRDPAQDRRHPTHGLRFLARNTGCPEAIASTGASKMLTGGDVAAATSDTQKAMFLRNLATSDERSMATAVAGPVHPATQRKSWSRADRALMAAEGRLLWTSGQNSHPGDTQKGARPPAISGRPGASLSPQARRLRLCSRMGGHPSGDEAPHRPPRPAGRPRDRDEACSSMLVQSRDRHLQLAEGGIAYCSTFNGL
eukprot:364816-Chlamydomonas_euryale.AAC.6